VISWTFFPGLLLSSLVATVGLLAAGYSPSVIVMGVIGCAALPILLLQRWMPFEIDWRMRPGGAMVDMLHMVTTGLTGDLWRALTFAGLYALAAWLATHVGATLWPTEWPVLLQLALALIIGDFGAYWVHRGCHTLPFFWRFHAMHHSSERLYVFSSGRNHPGNVIMAYGSQVLPCILLGAGNEVFALLSVFTAVHGMLQHCNVDLRHGALNWVFATADLHRWHHSADISESNTNFGSNLILWDIVFGTRSLPDGRPDELGLGDLRMPENFIAHLMSPLLLAKWEVEADAGQ